MTRAILLRGYQKRLFIRVIKFNNVSCLLNHKCNQARRWCEWSAECTLTWSCRLASAPARSSRTLPAGHRSALCNWCPRHRYLRSQLCRRFQSRRATGGAFCLNWLRQAHRFHSLLECWSRSSCRAASHQSRGCSDSACLRETHSSSFSSSQVFPRCLTRLICLLHRVSRCASSSGILNYSSAACRTSSAGLSGCCTLDR